jgi:hypothetical protein
MAALTSLEKQRARAIAEEYRNQGYEVIEEPSPGQLPDFLAGYHPDILIRKGDESIIVEVKSRLSLAKDHEVQELARILQQKPHWTFELAVVGEGEQFPAPEEARPLDRDDILRGIETAGRLFELGFFEAALLLAWSTLEATVRLLIEEEGIVLSRLNPSYILKQAVMNGVISRDDYNSLINIMEYRNALIHGFKITNFNHNLVVDLIVIIKGLL